MPADDPFDLHYRDETQEHVVSFRAMAGPCEVLVQSPRVEEARAIGRLAHDEAKRLEAKYSRYLEDNLISRIHRHEPVEVDEETARAARFRAQGVGDERGRLRHHLGRAPQVMGFLGRGHGARPGARSRPLVESIGWEKVSWDGRVLRVPEGMEVDLGGFGKEYAVDSAMQLVGPGHPPFRSSSTSGADLAANCKPLTPRPLVGGDPAGERQQRACGLPVRVRGDRDERGRQPLHHAQGPEALPHPQPAHTGWPVSQAPHSVTVAMPTCL